MRQAAKTRWHGSQFVKPVHHKFFSIEQPILANSYADTYSDQQNSNAALQLAVLVRAI
jgi:hypothetical protein